MLILGLLIGLVLLVIAFLDTPLTHTEDPAFFQRPDNVQYEFQALMDMIVNAPNTTELSLLEEACFDFESENRGRIDTIDMFSKLMIAVQKRGLMLSGKKQVA